MLRLFISFFAILVVSVASGTAPKRIPFRNAGSRIINGFPATLGQFPWQVALHVRGNSGSWFCGGSIIGEEWILTAGHCVSGASSARVQTGLIDLQNQNGVEVASSELVLHEEYNRTTLANDIGLVRLSTPLTFDENTAPITLSSADDFLGDGTEITISGWGRTSTNSSMSQILNYIKILVISNSMCQDYYQDDQIYDGMVCAISTTNLPRNTCMGDSGGPVVTNADTDPLHAAIVSFVSDEGCEFYPSGHTRTAYYRKWIQEKTGI